MSGWALCVKERNAAQTFSGGRSSKSHTQTLEIIHAEREREREAQHTEPFIYICVCVCVCVSTDKTASDTTIHVHIKLMRTNVKDLYMLGVARNTLILYVHIIYMLRVEAK